MTQQNDMASEENKDTRCGELCVNHPDEHSSGNPECEQDHGNGGFTLPRCTSDAGHAGEHVCHLGHRWGAVNA